MDKKKVAKYAHAFIGGKPKVFRYYNDDKSRQIDIMTCTGGECEGIDTYATIGMCDVDIGLWTGDNVLRVELMMAGPEGNDLFANILASAAFDAMTTRNCAYGDVIPNTITTYLPDSEMKHLVLLSPVFWSKYRYLETKGTSVSWLLAVPVSDRECAFIKQFGINAFDELLEEKEADIFDLYRDSIV